MGHKIILCVNERGILLASLCSGGRGLAAGGRGTRGSRLSSEKRWCRGKGPCPAQMCLSEGAVEVRVKAYSLGLPMMFWAAMEA